MGDKTPKRAPRLRTMADVKTLLARVVRETYTGRLDLGKAKGLGYLLNILKGVVEAHDFEQRLEEVERRMDKHDQQ